MIQAHWNRGGLRWSARPARQRVEGRELVSGSQGCVGVRHRRGFLVRGYTLGSSTRPRALLYTRIRNPVRSPRHTGSTNLPISVDCYAGGAHVRQPRYGTRDRLAHDQKVCPWPVDKSCNSLRPCASSDGSSVRILAAVLVRHIRPLTARWIASRATIAVLH